MQAFLEFVNFYCQFIVNFSQWICSFIECSKSKIFLIRIEKQKIRYNLFAWITNYQKTFDDLKTFFSAFILAHFDLNKKIWIETDASDFVTAEILSQMHDEVFWLVVFFSKKMSLTECNYMIYDKKLLVIIQSFEIWWSETANVFLKNSMKIYIDYKNLKHFMMIKQLNCWQICWTKFLSEFNFKIMY